MARRKVKDAEIRSAYIRRDILEEIDRRTAAGKLNGNFSELVDAALRDFLANGSYYKNKYEEAVREIGKLNEELEKLKNERALYAASPSQRVMAEIKEGLTWREICEKAGVYEMSEMLRLLRELFRHEGDRFVPRSDIPFIFVNPGSDAGYIEWVARRR